MDYGMALLPRPADGESVGTFGGFNIGINKNSEQKDLAWEFVKYSTKRDVNEKITMLTPAHKEAAKSYLNERRGYPDVIYEQLTKALYRPMVPNYPELAEIQRQATQKVLLDQVSVKEALREASEKINDLLK